MNTWFRQFGEVWQAVAPMRPIVLAYRGSVVILLVTGVLVTLAEGIGISLFIPLLQGLAQDHATTSGSLQVAFDAIFGDLARAERLKVISLSIVAVLVVKAALGYAHGLLYAWVDASIGDRLRRTVFARLLGVEYGFIDRAEHGEVLNTLTSETWRTVDAVRTGLWMVITAWATAIYVVILLLISWRWTLVVGAAMLLIAALVRLLNGPVSALGEEATRANAALTTRMVEGLAAMKLVRAYGRETYEQERFGAASRGVSRVFYRLALVSSAVAPLYEILTALLLGGVLLVSLRDVANLPIVLVFIFVLYRLQPKVRALDGGRLGLVSALPAIRKVGALLTLEVSANRHGGTARPAFEESIRFEHVAFRYGPGHACVLKEITVTVPAGKTTAIVGISGAGKSTLIKLLLRFYEPTTGDIFVGETPLRVIDLRQWRDRTALVSQDVYLFNATVFENIQYGREGASMDDVVEAARLAHAHAFISALPQGYETRLGERGTRLSGGQQQRIALARALVRDPELLILDEATNALDAISEQVVQEALETLRGDRTIVVVAHRFSTIEQADHVIVLEDGRVSEQGTPQELIRAESHFAQMFRLQHQTFLS